MYAVWNGSAILIFSNVCYKCTACFVLFTPGLLTALFTGPLKLERLVWGGDPIPMPVGIGISLRIGSGGPLTRMWVVQTHRVPPSF